MLLDLAWKNLWRRKLRSLLTILGVASAVQLYLMVHGVMGTYTGEIKGQINAFAGKIVIQQQVESGGGNPDLTSSASSLTEKTAEGLLATDGIDRRSSSALLFVPIARAVMPYLPPAVVAVGIEPGHESAYLGGLKAASGRLTLESPEDVILGQGAVDYYREESGGTPVVVGSTISVGGRTMAVVGILADAPQMFGNAVIMPLPTAQAVFDRAGTVSSVILTAQDTGSVGTIQSAIQNGFSGVTVSTQDDMLRSASTILTAMNGFMGMIENSIIIVAVVVVTIVVIVSVMEARREIGTLRAVGARRWRIFAMVAGQSIVLSMLGTLVALPIALFFVQWGMSEYLSSTQGVLQIWWQTLMTAVGVGLAASFLPAWQAVRVDPLESLRYE
jgi:ABC-type antimicrobial peptide transport system permease subunit